MRGVPRQRRAISSAAASSIDTVSSSGRTLHDRFQLVDIVRIQAQHQPEPSAQRCADQPLPRGRTDRRELRHRQRYRPRSRTRTHQDIDPEILQRRVEHLLHVGQQPVHFVDEEDLVQPDIAENAGEVQLLLQHRT